MKEAWQHSETLARYLHKRENVSGSSTWLIKSFAAFQTEKNTCAAFFMCPVLGFQDVLFLPLPAVYKMTLTVQFVCGGRKIGRLEGGSVRGLRSSLGH